MTRAININIARMQRTSLGSHFQAYRLQGATPSQLDPFIGIDHAWMSEPTFPPHPHAGFSAVTYLFLDSETGIQNRDSRGNQTLIEPGGLHWMASGRGVVHEEIPAVTGRAAHLLQIFVNLPQLVQNQPPFALTLVPADVPVVQYAGVSLQAFTPLSHHRQM
jgi:redox-sensitive bicupin YhaK (pirin superfamily)